MKEEYPMSQSQRLAQAKAKVKAIEKKLKAEGKEMVKVYDSRGPEAEYKIEIRDRKKSGCFVATAVYGDIDAPQVQVLREFRDDVLMRNEVGRTAVNFYYSGFGEGFANFIKTHTPSTIPLIRRGLDSLVKRYTDSK